MSLRIPRPPRIEDEDVLGYFEDVEAQLKYVGSVTVNVGNITAGTTETFTITVPGVRPDQGQAVCLAPPSAIEAGLVWSGYVSDDDEVTVRLMAHATGDVNPTEAVWGCRVFP